jgi:hypothetical protein
MILPPVVIKKIIYRKTALLILGGFDVVKISIEKLSIMMS